MKMETSLTAPFHGRVRRRAVGPQRPGRPPRLRCSSSRSSTATGRPADAGERARSRSRHSPGAPACSPREPGRLEWLMLGYDVDAAAAARIVADLHGDCADLSCDPALIPASTACSRCSPTSARWRGRATTTRAIPSECAQPAGAPPRLPRSLDAEAEGLPAPSSSAPARGARALRRRRPGPHARPGGGVLPPVPRPSSAARRAAGRARDPRPPARAPTARGAVGDDLREALDRLVVATSGCDQMRRDLARQVRFRCFDEPVIAARARARLRRDGGARRGAGRRARAPGSGASGSPRSSRARGRWRRCSLRRMATAGPALRRVLLEVVARRFYRVRDARGLQPRSTLDGHPLLLRGATGTKGRGGTSPRRSWTSPASTAPPARFRRLGRLRARRRRWRSPTSTSTAGGTGRRGDRRAAARGCSPTVALPASVHRIVVGVAPAGRGPSACPRSAPSPSGPAPDGLVEDEVLRGLHPMMAAPPAPVAASRVRARAAAVGRGRLPLPRLGPLQPEGRAAVRARRGARPHAGARRDGRVTAPARARAHARRGARGHPPLPGAPQAEPPAAMEPRPPARLAGDRPARRRRSARSSSAWRPPTDRPRRRDAAGPRAACATRRDASATACCASSRRRGAASSSRSTIRRRSRCARSTRARADRLRAPARDAAPGRDRQAARARARRDAALAGQPVGEFVEHDLDADGRLVPVDRPAACNNLPASSWG